MSVEQALPDPTLKRPASVDDASCNGNDVKRRKVKLHGRAFYESIGSPKLILAPMVDQSEFAWRMLSRSFFPQDPQRSLLAYSPMFHSRLFAEKQSYRDEHFQPMKSKTSSPPASPRESSPEEKDHHRDGHPTLDRPLFVQFCSNTPDDFLAAAKYVQHHCDAVDLNLGCPQGIAKRGNYGAFLQEDQDLICSMVNKLHLELDVPVTAKMRVLETKEKSLAYARRIVDAGASIVTIHGRQREQKGHNTGLADWAVIKYVKDNLPPETVVFANGNVLMHEDIERCLQETGADGVMSAEGNLHDPAIFAPPPAVGENEREYWRGRDGRGGWRMDAVMRRYFDIIYEHVLEKPSPTRSPLFIPEETARTIPQGGSAEDAGRSQPNAKDLGGLSKNAFKKLNRKKRKKMKVERVTDPNLCAMQSHLFSLLKALVGVRHEVRDALAHTRAGDMDGFENVLMLVEKATKEGLLEYEQMSDDGQNGEASTAAAKEDSTAVSAVSSAAAIARCKREWWICQPYVRPFPTEAYESGAMQFSKKDLARLAKEVEAAKASRLESEGSSTEARHLEELPKESVVCG